jgi:MFS family permease
MIFTASNALVGAMVFSLLATEVPVERRSQTLNLVYLPLYAAGIIGPAIGGTLAAAFGTSAPFYAAAAVFLIGSVVVTLRVHPARAGATAPA